jgi:prepilin-type N-terminal cleavage/methylation domain-containing protein|tara:strand:- start:5421 stop:5978 length:558 start_codon:yes stop_codon:yes gene_type:complete
MLRGFSRERGFTIVELLIVVVVIGILAAITIVAYNGVTSAARDAQIATDLRNIKQAVTRLEVDTGGTVFNCPGGGTTFGPESAIDTAVTGLVSAPTVGAVRETCEWSTTAVNSWNGPYIQALNDPWDRPYFIDLDYFICDSGNGQLIAAVLTRGEDGDVDYPTSANSGACTTTASDDTYMELWRS